MEIPCIADLIARPRRIIKLSPAKKQRIAEYESRTASYRASKKLDRLAKTAASVEPSDAVTVTVTDQQTEIPFDHAALAHIVRIFAPLIDDDEEMRERVITVATAHLRHEAGAAQAYREMNRMLSERMRR